MTGSNREESAPGSLEFEPGSGLRKIRAPAALRLDDLVSAGRPVPVIVEVTEPGYRPGGLDVRAHISSTFLSGTVQPVALQDLDRDPRVVAVEISRPLGMID